MTTSKLFVLSLVGSSVIGPATAGLVLGAASCPDSRNAMFHCLSDSLNPLTSEELQSTFECSNCMEMSTLHGNCNGIDDMMFGCGCTETPCTGEIEAYYTCALRCGINNPMDLVDTFMNCDEALEETTSCINTDCSNCINTLDPPSTCLGIDRVIDSCESCSNCGDSIATLFSCLLGCDEDTFGPDDAVEGIPGCESETGDFFDCAFRQLSEREFDSCDKCIDSMPDKDIILDETCQETQAFLDGCDCGPCNTPFEELFECAIRKNGKNCDYTVDGSSRGIPTHDGIHNMMSLFIIFMWLWMVFVNW